MDKSANRPQKVADALKQSWVYRLLPQSIWPYAQLARWERPIGWWLLMWPGWWSIMLAHTHFFAFFDAAPVGVWQKIMVLFSVLVGDIVPFLLLFMLGAIIMRGAGCTYNDLADQSVDDKVARTRSRPLPSGRVSRTKALLFLMLQLFCGLVILLQFNQFAFWVGALSLITVVIYPFMKRVTWWPQLFLGFAFSWGGLLGWAVVVESLGLAAFFIYTGSIAWVIGYDTIYAHQDKEDDALVGVKSTARLFGEKTKLAISLLYATAIALFAAAILQAVPHALSLNWLIVVPAFTGLLVGGAQMFWQIRTLDIDDPDQCLKLFKSNSHFGWILFAGFTGSLIFSVVL